jgi:D-arabinose 1-dehydrogenase-like Zn-dependent alcohol dehydrogenase
MSSQTPFTFGPVPGSIELFKEVADAVQVYLDAELRGVRAMIETYPLEQAAEAYARMMSGNAEFRVVLKM